MMDADDLATIFPGDSEMARRMRVHDWSATPLGDPRRWPDGLKVPVRMMLSSRFEMWLGWGPDLLFFYNDAYRPTLGDKHEWALGQPMRTVWYEVYETVKDRILSVMDDGVASWDKALLLVLERNGYSEETYHSFSYSPLHGDGGTVAGLMCVVTEETERVISERRLATLRMLADGLLGNPDEDAVIAATADTLARNRADFPFALLYLNDGDDLARARAATADAEALTMADWRFDAVAAAGGAIRMSIPAGAGPLPTGDWPVPPTEALLVTIPGGGDAPAFGTLVLGLNPYRPVDPDIAGFAGLVAGQVAAALANAAALDGARRRAERMWVNARDLLVVLNADGIVQSVNPSWTRLLGYAEHDVVGHHFSDFLHPDEIASSGAGAIALPTVVEHRVVGRNGTVHWIAWSASLEDGAVYAHGRDISAEKSQEAALAKAEDALRQAQKMEAVGQLTGGLAHDFNNLLTGISGSLELMQMRVDQGRYDAVPKYVGAAQGAARRAAALTQRLLAFARRQTLDPKPIDVNRLVVGMEDLVRRSVGPQVAVEVAGTAGLWPTLVDPPQLENALLNLCINARDAMPDGGRITIETANKWLDDRAGRDRDLPPGQYVSLCVTDTGTGMAPHVIERAFDPFFTTKPIGLGTGLGLSMIYGFARQSGGQVRIYSELGQGTTICIYLPRYHGDAAIENPDEHRLAARPLGDGEVVLVVDDEPTVRMLVSEVLEDAGYACIEAKDGPTALRILQAEGRIDLLVTDVGLPSGMNGRQVADAARALRPGLKTLFITGYAENAAVGNGHLEPGMELLTKPFAMEALATKIHRMLDNVTGQ